MPVEGVTACNASQCHPSAPPCAVAVNGLVSILGARRLKAASWRTQRTPSAPIHANHPEEQCARHLLFTLLQDARPAEGGYQCFLHVCECALCHRRPAADYNVYALLQRKGPHNLSKAPPYQIPHHGLTKPLAYGKSNARCALLIVQHTYADKRMPPNTPVGEHSRIIARAF